MSQATRLLHDDRQMPLETARWALAKIWFSVSAVLFLLFAMQSLLGTYSGENQRFFAWALPTILPTLSLMVGVFVADALQPFKKVPAMVRRNFFQLTRGLSIFYLLMLFIVVLGQPFFVGEEATVTGTVAARLSVLEGANLFLSPLQGLVVMALGALFFTKKEPPADGNADDAKPDSA